MHAPDSASLPDLLRRADGTAIVAASEARRHIDALGVAWVELVYGRLPPRPAHTQARLLHRIEVAALGGAVLGNWRVHCGPQQSFMLQLLRPPGDVPCPVVLSGDGCWRSSSDEAVSLLLRRGHALAQFNRVEIAPDLAAPHNGQGAIAAWAWGYQRCVDVLCDMAEVDATRIAVTGHSRGGKAALLAGATDTRIALTHANNSGAGGSGSWRHQGPGSETLARLVAQFPHWMGAGLPAWAGREHQMPSDQHLLKAMLAPRALLTTDAIDDLWANPSGCRLTHEAAQAVFALLGDPRRSVLVMREGGHALALADWLALLDFADECWAAAPPSPALR